MAKGRTGRQPASNPSGSSSKPRGNNKKTKTSVASKAQQKQQNASSSALDVYSYSSSVKRARGDIDPEARASSSKKKKQQQGGKGKGKGRQQDAEADDDEDDESSDGMDEDDNGVPEGLYMGGGSDDEGGARINSEDDEEIDSDEASGGEEDLLPSKSKKGKAAKATVAEIDLDEDEIDYSDEDGEGFMDASEMFDQYQSSEEDDSGESGDDSDSDASSGTDSEYEGALNKLSSFVDGLESKKRKVDDVEEQGGKKKKRVVLKEKTEAYPEGEFTAVGDDDDGKVNLDDLLASFADSKNPKLAALRKSLKPLAAATSTAPSTSSGNYLKASGPLAAPLPGRLQDKIDREAAYEKTKEETDKWNDTVRRMKGESGIGVEGARHERLTLPLMGGAGDVRRDPNAAEWSAKFQPTNELEASIQSLLAAGQMSEADLRKAEKTALAALDPADVAARQAELRQQRDLMYRAERKAKRVAKIKSKAFRRIHRRAKGKDGEPDLSLEDLAEMDKLDGGDRVTEEKARLEILRARERATLKHSSKGGRWSKTNIGGLEGLDEERNSAVRDMAARNEQLRKRIAGINDDDDSGDEFAEGDSDEGGASDEEGDFDSIRRKAFDELASLEAKDAAAVAALPQAKGVLGMKFMKDAMAREERKVQGSAEELRRKLERMDEMADAGLGEDEDAMALSEQVQGNLGRMVFGPSSTVNPTASTSKPTQHTTKLSAPLAVPTAARPSTRSPLSSGVSSTAVEANPWLTVGEEDGSSGKISRKMNKASTGKDSRDAARLTAKVDRHKSKQADAREAERDDAQVEINPSNVLAGAKAPAQPQITAPARSKAAAKSKATTTASARPTMDAGDDASSDEDDEEQHEAQRGRGPAAFKQRDLVAKAFAGDNVVADFEAEKRREIERDAPREEDNTLPGWGSWAGKGVKKQKNAKKFITKIAGIAPESRKDANHTNVIISEKKDKKAAKYLLKDLPFPYTSAAQHEHKLRTPMGAEWSTSTVLRDQTLPSVLIKPGVTIRPVDHKTV